MRVFPGDSDEKSRHFMDKRHLVPFPTVRNMISCIARPGDSLKSTPLANYRVLKTYRRDHRQNRVGPSLHLDVDVPEDRQRPISDG